MDMQETLSHARMEEWGACVGGQWKIVDGLQGEAFSEPLWEGGTGDYYRYLTAACSSTMDVGRALGKKGRFPGWSWVLAGTQTRGRGQLGRSWVSSAGNLFATLRLPDAAHGLHTRLPLALGCVLVSVFEKMGLPAEVKWPNDILVGRIKVGGILVETRGRELLAGFGINVGAAPREVLLPAPLRFPAGALRTFGVDISVPALWMAVERALHDLLPAFAGCPERVVRRLDSCLAFREETVVVSHAGPWDGPATLVGISDAGGAVVRTARGTHTLYRGRLTPRVC